MIKIYLEKEESIREFHYNNLCGALPGKTQNVIQLFDKYISKFGHIRYYCERLEFLKGKTLRNPAGFSILTAKPKELSGFIDDFEKLFPQPLTPKFVKILNCIFYYESYSKWKAYELGVKINSNVCPYCNRSYTFIVGNDAVNGTRFEYDHFFSQEQHPYLKLSFYNLVPSCHICNANLKHTKKFCLKRNLHPYIEGFGDDILFSIQPRSIHFINGKDGSYTGKFRKGIGADYAKSRRSMNNVSVFRLKELYNMHRDYIDELIKKAQIYNADYVDSLYSQFGGTLFADKGDIKQFITGNYLDEKNYSKRVLSKLSRDIAAELGLV